MANINVNNGRSEKKGKPKRQLLRVDFTPMVDMNMLLITFFMFCTTLSMPQIMKLAMPTNEGEQKIPQSGSATIILGENDKIYFYDGMPDYEDYTSLKVMDQQGLRTALLERNSHVVAKMRDLWQEYSNKALSKEDYNNRLKEVKKAKEGLNILIKPTKESNYRNLVDVLDEMLICGIDRYTIVDMEEADEFLVENLKTEGKLRTMSVK